MKKNTIFLPAKIILVLIAYVGVIVLAQYLLLFLPIDNFTTPFKMIIYSILPLSIGLITLYIFRRFLDRKNFLSIGFSISGHLNDFVKGAFIAIAIMLVGILILELTGSIQIESFQFRTSYLVASFIMFISTAVLEEMFYRGYILNNLLDVTNRYIALVISALIFSSMHFFSPNLSFLSFLNIFLVGILLGLPYVNNRNLLFPIGFHLFWNFLQGILGYNVSGDEVPSILILHYNGNNEVNGGIFGFEGSLVCTILLIISILLIIRYYKSNKQVNILVA